MSVSSPVLTLPITQPVSTLARPLRRAALEDLERVLELEALCFDPVRRDSRSTIRRSLANPRHEAWVLGGPGDKIDAALFLRHVRNALRVYSVATHPMLRGQGWGNLLLDWAISRAVAQGKDSVTLEADASNPELMAWYERHAFRRARFLPSYYAPGRDAWRLAREIDPSRAS